MDWKNVELAPLYFGLWQAAEEVFLDVILAHRCQPERSKGSAVALLRVNSAKDLHLRVFNEILQMPFSAAC